MYETRSIPFDFGYRPGTRILFDGPLFGWGTVQPDRTTLVLNEVGRTPNLGRDPDNEIDEPEDEQG